MKTREGDLIALARAGAFDVIVHGCNCFCSMEAGIARIIAREFPAALAADRATAEGDRTKLGTITTAHEHIGGHTGGHGLTIVNAYTQFHFASGGRLVDYAAVSSCFDRIAQDFGDRRIGYPMIGAGLGGGDWDEIAARIDRSLKDADHTLVALPKNTAP